MLGFLKSLLIFQVCILASNCVVSQLTNTKITKVTLEYKYLPKIQDVINEDTISNILPQFVFPHDGIIYLLYDNRSVKIYDTHTNNVIALDKLNLYLDKNYHGIGVTGLYINDDLIYIGLGCRKIAVFHLNTNEFMREINCFQSCINNFGMLNGNLIYAFNSSEFYIVENLQCTGVKKTTGILPEVIISSNEEIAVASSFGTTVTVFNNFGKEIDYRCKTEDEMVSFKAILGSNLVWLDSQNKGLLIYNKITSKTNYSAFDKNFIDSNRQSPIEDPFNGIRVATLNESTLYFFLIKDNILNIFKVTI